MPEVPQKTITEIKSLARAHAPSALKVLSGIMNQPTASKAARVAAANSLLDRGFGKPAQVHAGDPNNPIVHRHDKIIIEYVRPKRDPDDPEG